MKKKLLKLFATLFACATLALGFAACEGKHEHAYTAVVTAPTCTEQGFTTHTCTCGDSYIADYVNALDHEFTNYVSDNNASCGVDGTETATCNRDGCNVTDTRTEENSALDHEFTNYVSDNNATYDEDGTKTATCNRDGCNEKDTITDEGTKLQSSISFKTLSVNGDEVTGNSLSNATKEFSFAEEIQKIGNADFIVALDEFGLQTALTKIVPLAEGDNVFYVFQMENGEISKTYTVTLRRRPIYTVSFYTNGGTAVQTQTIEEGFLATEPETTKAGYTFTAWDYDFTTPITKPTTITASWTANTDTPYKIEYYLQNLEDNNYTLQETVNKTGKTDTTVNAEIKEFPHFTYNSYNSKARGNVHGNGSQVLKVYYTRNTYTLSKNNSFGAITSQGAHKYGKRITTTATPYLGYHFLGWYSEDTLLSTDTTYTFTLENNVTANFEMKEEMSNFNFTSSTTTCSITGIKDKTVTEMIIPDYVTSIGDRAFSNCYSLTSIEIPDSVTSIGERAFADCYSLTSIEIPDSVTSIGKYAFEGCSILTIYCEAESKPSGWASDWNYSNRPVVWDCNNNDVADDGYIYVMIDNLRYCIKDGVATVVIRQASNIQTATIPASITYKGTSYNVTSIGYRAFFGCSSLASVKIPDSVTSIGSSAFAYCSSLKEITLPFVGATKDGTSNKHFGYIFGASDYYYNDNDVPTSLKKVTVTGGNIGDDAFAYCYSLTSVVIGDSVTSIGKRVFYNCSSLTSVAIGDSVTSIGEYAFVDCDNLTSVVIGDSVTSIGERAFFNCSSLTSLEIPDSVTSIGEYAFCNCSSLTIYCEAASQPSGWASDWNVSNCPVVWDYNNNEVANDGYIYVMIDTIRYGIKDGVAMVTRQASNIQTATIPASITYKGTTYNVTSIGEDAFFWCESLTSVEIGDSVTSIGDSAFYWCSSLTSVVIPDSVTSIGDSAFDNCDSLTSIEIPDSVTSIGDYAFLSCESLTSITVDENNTTYKSIDGNLYSKDGKTLIQYAIGKTATSFTIPDAVTSIGNYAFYNCDSLTSIEIPDSVTSIGNSAFFDCSSLTSVVIGDSVTSIGEYAFAWCTSLTIYCEAASQPSGWDSSWNYSNRPVVWGYKE